MNAHIDRVVLARLCHDLGGDKASVGRFAGKFVSHWCERAARLEKALGRSDASEAGVVLLSIRTTSSMLGAVHLEAESALMLGALSRCDFAGCRLSLSSLTRIGDETCLELTELFRSA
ncbi:hypothetical protein JF66_14975 [Cryobacterium sp. MLB-32]|uniref:hypothetical protein n=1 Tax=Cryobacterium sp. MLB-32 TaxID=1529318 RepID=UPI0004E68095|nr:hypothetical protein [Cryobacterium sp. MLB-32]KFF58922.1 hypothetical protein JF66_14975 [Cryobacterium sp. MLB-32]